MENHFDPQELMENFIIYRRGKVETHILKPGGEDIIVDNENKQEYVNLW
jgi:hypothetical protein